MAFAKVLTLDEVPGYLRTSDFFKVLTGIDDNYLNGEYAIDTHDDFLAVACKLDLLINNIWFNRIITNFKILASIR